MDIRLVVLLAALVAVNSSPTTLRVMPTNDYRHSDLNLELLQVVYRHGDRTPTKTFPTDPNAKVWSEMGYGQLTNMGKMQHFQFGQFLKARYMPGFLKESYDRDEVFVQSTDVDRTLMSAQANLAALYPPQAGEAWNPDLHWQPIPVHTLPAYMDYVFDDVAECPRYQQLWNEQMKSPEMRSFDLQNRDLYDLLTNMTGKTVENISGVSSVYSNLLAAHYHNLTIPDWYTTAVKTRSLECHNKKFVWFAKTLEMQRVMGGPVWGRLLTNIQSKVNGTIPKRKGFFYSSHDTIIASAMSALEVFNGIAPPYASALFVELLTDAAGSRFVQFLYRNTTAVVDPLIPLTIPGCPSDFHSGTPLPCPLELLVSLTANVVSDDVIAECGSALLPERTPLVVSLDNDINQNSIN